MATMTLLEMTQSILSAMDSDPADSISDTVEAEQVALIVKETYFELMSRREWSFLRGEFQLTEVGDTSNPTKLRIPTTVNKINWFKYNKTDVDYMPPKAFRDMIDERDTDADNVDANGFITDRDPLYWTSFDDDYIICDSYDSDAEDTLKAVNTKAYGVTAPSWTHSNTFVPDLPEKYFPTFLAECKAQAFVNIKQQANNREESKAKRGLNIMQQEHWKNEAGEPLFNGKINYGRK